MSRDIKYIKNNETYVIKRKKLNIKNGLIFLVLPLVIFLLLGVYYLSKSLEYRTNTLLASYNEIGIIDYKVYLNDNDFYETSYLEKDMNYISSLISRINTKFKYEMHSTEMIDFTYDYKIVATLNILDKTDKNKKLFTKDYTLKEEKDKKVLSTNFVVNEEVDIDYSLYNNYANSFKNEYGLTSNAELVVKVKFNVKGNISGYEEVLQSKSPEMSIIIPLSQQLVSISNTNSSFNINDNMLLNSGFIIKNNVLFIIGLILIILNLITMSGLIILLLIYVMKNKDPYQKALRKILRENDTYIVTAKNSFNESENVIRVDSFEELLDAQRLEGRSIVFYEVVPNHKSYFVLSTDNGMFRFTLTREYQENLLRNSKK